MKRIGLPNRIIQAEHRLLLLPASCLYRQSKELTTSRLLENTAEADNTEWFRRGEREYLHLRIQRRRDPDEKDGERDGDRVLSEREPDPCGKDRGHGDVVLL